MKKQDPANFVIRSKRSPIAHLWDFCLIVALWIVVATVIFINVSFILGSYSDALVSFYVLFNLNYATDAIILKLIVTLAVIMLIYSIFRLVYLRRHQNEPKN